MLKLEDYLRGDDLRSLGHSAMLLRLIKDQETFDELFAFLFHHDRITTMRAADVIEKITRSNSHFLFKHKAALLRIAGLNNTAELKWHLALLLSRVRWRSNEKKKVWELLKSWSLDKRSSKIVRVNSLQGLFELSTTSPSLTVELKEIFKEVQKENIPSINARIRKLYLPPS